MRASLACMALVLLAACSSGDPSGIHDPWEETNRRIHQFNSDVDQSLIRNASDGYGNVMSDQSHELVGNFADTVALPGTVVNQVLQGRPDAAFRNTIRFTMNATIGFAGLIDVAKDLGLPQDQTDFGATLATWGVPEGPYVVVPIYGPSTARDSVGGFLGIFTNPIVYAAQLPGFLLVIAADIADDIGDRSRYSDSVDSILYESADSYSQFRLIYLQSRRYELGQDIPADDVDPLELDTEGF